MDPAHELRYDPLPANLHDSRPRMMLHPTKNADTSRDLSLFFPLHPHEPLLSRFFPQGKELLSGAHARLRELFVLFESSISAAVHHLYIAKNFGDLGSGCSFGFDDFK